jgi:hypothetical protein
VHAQIFHSRDCRAAGCVAIAAALLPHVLVNLFCFLEVCCVGVALAAARLGFGLNPKKGLGFRV